MKEGVALLLTADIVELRANHNQRGDVTWADCELRDYFNGEFFKSFSMEEQKKFC